MNKKGVNLISSNVLFIILNLIVFAVLLYFIARAGTGAAFYEQAYAKQIALMIDGAEPGTAIVIDLSDIKPLVKKEKLSFGSVFKIDNKKNEVTVKLTKTGKSYSYNFFSDYNVEIRFDTQNPPDKPKLRIFVE